MSEEFASDLTVCIWDCLFMVGGVSAMKTCHVSYFVSNIHVYSSSGKSREGVLAFRILF